jgi:glycosyltransferase involved in cell wall biosynthesis
MQARELAIEPNMSLTTKAKRLVKRGMQRCGVRVGFLTQHAAIPLQLSLPRQRALARTGLPVVSIVTPSFNHVHFIEATMRSVLDQGYPHLEYIVVDGGSTDGSADVIRSYEKRLAHWSSEPDRGQAHAINKGMARSTGSIMAWLNSDDLLLPGAIDYVVDWFNSHPNVDAVYGNRIVIDHGGNEVGRWILPRHAASALRWRDYVPQETLFWRRSLWDRIGGRINEEFQFAMDWELLLRFHRAGARFARLPRFIGAFRTHPQQKSLALVESVGRGEFRRLHEDYGGPRWAHAYHRLASSAYVARSVAYTWLYKMSSRPQ